MGMHTIKWEYQGADYAFHTIDTQFSYKQVDNGTIQMIKHMFKDYHSMIEMKRYMIRFIQFQPRMEIFDGQIHTKYNEFDSYIDPILHWLRDKGVHFVNEVTVTDLQMNSDYSVVTKIVGKGADGEFEIPVSETDMVISTLASMTQNSTHGDNTHTVTTNLSTEKGFFSVWEKLATREPKFGHPEKFDSNVEKSKWMSAFVCIKGYKEFCAKFREKYGYPKDCVTGAISIMDSSWDISFVLYDKYFANQADDEDFLWFDGLWGENIGDYVKKPMAECTGEEIMQEFLYHLGMLDEYVELDGDVVFTVETSVRTAMMAAYGLTGIDRKVLPLYQGQYDIRWLVMCAKKMMQTDEIKFNDLPPINPLTVKKDIQGMLDFINSVPELSWDDEHLY